MKKIILYNKLRFIYTAFVLFIFVSCDPDKNDTPPPVVTPVQFAKGADISWLTQMESSGRIFYNSSGTAQECMQLLKSLGMNSIRLRVWVDPAGGWNNTADVVAKAIRAKNLGMKIMIDFHYSDSWADPGQQTKPAAWLAQDFTTLQTSVYNHTFNVLTALKSSRVPHAAS